MTEKKTKKQGAASTATTATASIAAADYQKLAIWNKGLALLFGVQALLLAIFAKAVTAPVSVGYSAVDQLASDAAKHRVLATASRHILDVPIVWALVAALLIFAVIHLAMATIYRKRYEADLALGLNRWRWAQLGLGGGLLLVIVSMLSGVQLLGLLVAIWFFMVVAAILLLVTERIVVEHKGKEPRMSHLLCGAGVGATIFPWFVLAGGALAAWMFDGKIPLYLYGVYGSALVLVIALGVATHLRIKRHGKWADTLYAERVYMLLTLALVAVVVWQVFAGSLM